jgi:poly [ADP-ribose] polymerase
LRIAPPEAPVSGYMFGKGVYLADMFEKSYGYSSVKFRGQNSNLVLLCEAALGNSKKLLEAN